MTHFEDLTKLTSFALSLDSPCCAVHDHLDIHYLDYMESFDCYFPYCADFGNQEVYFVFEIATSNFHPCCCDIPINLNDLLQILSIFVDDLPIYEHLAQISSISTGQIHRNPPHQSQ